MERTIRYITDGQKVENNTIKELLRKTDQMASMHAMLHDKYQKYSLSFDALLIISSTILCTAIFADKSLFEYCGIAEEQLRIIIGICAVINFIIAIFSYRIGWKEKADRHGRARDKLCELKAAMNESLSEADEPQANTINNLQGLYTTKTESIANIPEKDFHRLKAKHLKKIALSKFIDDNAGLPYWIMRIKFFLTQFGMES